MVLNENYMNKYSAIYVLLGVENIFLGIYFVLTNTKYIFGSTIDFKMQHYIIPEYFRTLFYETGDLFPDFALNLSGGINIFYLSYYGFLSPIILLSYLFPFVSIIYGLIVAITS